MRKVSVKESDAITANYPPSGDSKSSFHSFVTSPHLVLYAATSSGGYGSVNSFSPVAQRGIPPLPLMDETSAPRGGSKTAISQSTTGTDLTSELQDAQQGIDHASRREMREHGEWGPGLNPYGQSTFESHEEARRELGKRYGGHEEA